MKKELFTVTVANFNYEEELSKCKTMEDITGANGLVQKIIKNAMETIIQNEFNQFLSNQTSTQKNYRNGYNKKNIKTEKDKILRRIIAYCIL